MSNLLYVTSCARDMWHASAKELLRSFLETASDGRIVCYTEGWDQPAVTGAATMFRRLDPDPWLSAWIKNNADVIPTHLGGTAGSCQCPTPESRDYRTHVPGCHYHWFNRNASRWLRKVAALRAAMAEFRSSDPVVWLDADVRFRQRVATKVVTDAFRGGTYWFHKGPGRDAIESGIMGFHGREVIDAVASIYDTHYRNFERWDDGYIWWQAVQAYPEWKVSDVAHPRLHRSRVVERGWFRKYFDHAKGRHGNGIGVMR